MPTVAINTAASGDTTLVAAPGAGKRIRVLGAVVQAAGAVNVTFKSGSTARTGPMPQAANTGWCWPVTPEGWFDCGDNEALVVTLSAAVQVSGAVRYIVFGG